MTDSNSQTEQTVLDGSSDTQQSAAEDTTTGGMLDNVAEETQTQEQTFDWTDKTFETFREGEEIQYDKLGQSYKELRTKMARMSPPESTDLYEYAPENADPELLKSFKDEARKNRVTPEQFEWMMKKHEDTLSQATVTPEKVEATLKEQWGNDFETYVSDAKTAFGAYGKGLDADAVGNNPDVMRLLARIGKEMGEDKLSTKDINTPAPSITQADIDAAMQDGSYWNNDFQKKVAEFYGS